MDNCTGTGIDEASTEEEENCHFKVIHGKVMIVATRTIEPGEQLLTRYGYQYWMDSKWPLALLQIMFTKYRGIKPDGLTNKQWQQTCADWSKMIVTKQEDNQVRRLWRPRSILKTPNPRYFLVPCPAQAPRVTLPGQRKLNAPSKPRQQLLFMCHSKENIVVPPHPRSSERGDRRSFLTDGQSARGR